MAVSSIRAVIECDTRKVWETVTDTSNYSWRSDLRGAEASGGNGFAEYSKSGYKTVFTVTLTEPFKRWELQM